MGSSRRAAEPTAGPPLGDGMIAIKRPIGGRGPNLQHQMSASWRPVHVLPGFHSPVQQPLYGKPPLKSAHPGAVPWRGVAWSIMDIGFSANICLEVAQQSRHLSRRDGGQPQDVDDTVERDQRFANEIEAPSDLAVPQTPADPIDDFNEIRHSPTIVRREVRPAPGRLIDMLDSHR